MNLSSQTHEPLPARKPEAGCYEYRLIAGHHPDRPRVEQFIAERFYRVHGARLSSFMPMLLALFDRNGDIRAAVGIRSAAAEVLFLEYYLDSGIEHAIARRLELSGRPIERGEIVEIGNLASVDRRASLELFRFLAGVLQVKNYTWAVFTGCTALRKLFGRLGIETVSLGRASQARLPADQQTWGSYYEDNPTVLAGRVRSGGVLLHAGEAGEAFAGRA